MIKITLFLFLCFFAVAAQAKIRVACVGNSVTYGLGVEVRELNAYPVRLQQLLGEAYNVRNFGKNGVTLLSRAHKPYIKEEEAQQALDFEADIVVIHLGLNDTGLFNWPNYKDDFIPDYLSLIQSFKDRNKQVKIYICKLTPIFDWHPLFKSGVYNWYQQIQHAIEKVSSIAQVPLIDLYEDLCARPDLLPDSLHPNSKGADIIARRVYGAIVGNFGGLQLSPLFTDGMVLQRGQILRIVGKSNANKKVELQFSKYKTSTQSDFQGNWFVELPALSANKQGVNLIIKSEDQTVVFQDVVVGEVWLCSGQSNMEFPFKKSFEYHENKEKINKNVRLFRMQPLVNTNNQEWDSLSLERLNELKYFKSTVWAKAKQSELESDDFSAIALAFGSDLADSLDVPVGLIQNAVGGSTQEAWIDRWWLAQDPALIGMLEKFSTNSRVQRWCRLRAAKNIAKAANPLQRHPYHAGYLYETGIKSLNKYPIKGLIWYQGESNTHNVEDYKLLFKSFVNCWRDYWGTNFPVIYAQLSSISRPSWPYFRDAQRQLLNEIDNVAMVVTYDLGDSLDVHPSKKCRVGERMSMSALSLCYHKNFIYSGPLYKSFSRQGRTIQINFDYNEGLEGKGGDEIIGFEIAGKDEVYYPAKVRVRNGGIELKSEKVKTGYSARYAWSPFTRANLVNSLGLPASSFKTEEADAR